jgi:hypothetical protein
MTHTTAIAAKVVPRVIAPLEVSGSGAVAAEAAISGVVANSTGEAVGKSVFSALGDAVAVTFAAVGGSVFSAPVAVEANVGNRVGTGGVGLDTSTLTMDGDRVRERATDGVPTMVGALVVTSAGAGAGVDGTVVPAAPSRTMGAGVVLGGIVVVSTTS